MMIYGSRAAMLTMTQLDARRRDAEIAAARRRGVLLKIIAAQSGLTVARVSQICTRLDAKPPSDTFRCGHPRTPTNTVINGIAKCRRCKNEKAMRYYYARRFGRSRLTKP